MRSATELTRKVSDSTVMINIDFECCVVQEYNIISLNKIKY